MGSTRCYYRGIRSSDPGVSVGGFRAADAMGLFHHVRLSSVTPVTPMLDV